MYGVSFVVERVGTPGPQGGVFDRRVGDEDVYRIPGAAVATVTPPAPGGGWPADDAQGTPVPVSHRDPASWTLRTSSEEKEILRLRLTDVPGWRATIDGRPVALSRYAGVMQQIEVPPGRHVIEVTYWPKAFSVGLFLAACAAVGLVAAALLAWIIGRRRRDEAGASG